MRKSLLLASASLLLVAGVPALAQNTAETTAPGTNSSAEQGGVEAGAEDSEIIVTATRRAQALSDVPIAVSAVTAEQLQNSGANDIRQLNQLAPSLLVSSATNESSGVARIRGIGTVGENPGLESSVALFIDGVYRSRTGVGLSELGEIERIEVLRGPQGTLFGRNASAGLLNIVTKKPSFDHEGYAAATYGNYDFLRLEGGVTGAMVGDTVAMRLDGVYVQRDGFVKEALSGRGINDRDRYLVRGQLLVEPNDDLSIRIIGDYSQKNEECCAAVFLNNVQTNRRTAGGTVAAEPNLLFNTLQALGANYQLPRDGDDFVYRTSVTPGYGYRNDSEDYGLSGEINYDLGAATLTSITAYREFVSQNGQDGDFNALDILRREDQDRKFETFTQELRLQGTAFDDRLDWLVGGYYAHEVLTADDDIKYGNDYERFANCALAETFARNVGVAGLINTADVSCFSRPTAAALFANPALPAATRGQIAALAGLGSFIPGAPLNAAGGFRNIAAAIGFPTTGAFLNGLGVVRNQFEQTSRNYAFFTHNVIQVVPDLLSLTLGLRYTNERKTLEGTFNTNNAFCTAIRQSPFQALQGLPCVINSTAGTGLAANDPGRRRKEDEITGTAVLSFTPTEDLLTYASYSRGYKAGGFNLDTSALDPLCSPTFDTGTPQTTTGLPSCATRLGRPANQAGNGRAEAADLQFEPEIVDAFEVGLKWDGPGIDVNVAAFYQLFEQFQLNTFNGVNFEVTNIESCKDDLGGGDTDGNFSTGACTGGTRAGVISKGVELEVFASPAEDFNTTFGFTLADTQYRRNLTGTNGAPLSPALFQLPGRRLSNSSLYVVTGSFGYNPPVTATLRGLAYLDFRYQSELNTGSDLDIEKEQEGFFVMNARLGIQNSDRRWSLEFWAQNLLNTKFQQIAADAPLQGNSGPVTGFGTFRGVQNNIATVTNSSGLFLAFPGEPRTYGVTVRTRF